MKKLYPSHELNTRIRAYYFEKLKLCAGIIAAGLVLSLAINTTGVGAIEDGGRIHRNNYLKGDKIVNLNYEVIDQAENMGTIASGEIEVTVSEKQYTDAQIQNFSDEFDAVLMKNILGSNSSADYVTENLNFKSKIEGFPFTVSYRTDNPILLNSSGEINREKLIQKLEENSKKVNDDGIEVNVTANIKYADYEEEKTFGVMLYNHKLSYEEQVEEYIKNAVKYEDKRNVNSDYYALPSSINDKKVIFTEKNNKNGRITIMFVLAAAITVYFAKDKDIEKEVDDRNRQLKDEYSRFLNRFTLFYTAGMPVKSIWMKICNEYEKEREKTGDTKYLYEEMLLTKYKMKDGTKEIDAYEEFACRIGVSEYRAFISLIEQAVDKGKGDLAVVLKRETQDAFLEKVNRSKKLLEEAGTKLLMPMFMMLFVVMIMIMFPAFCSFK